MQPCGNLDQLAERLPVDPSRIYELLRSDHLPFVKDGGEIRFDRHEIDRSIVDRKVKVLGILQICAVEPSMYQL
jgi:excisionase family DNA binding protein